MLADEVIDLDNDKSVKARKRKTKHDISGKAPERKRRAVKKSKYLESPYDEAVYESKCNKMQKDISTFAWSNSLDE